MNSDLDEWPDCRIMCVLTQGEEAVGGDTHDPGGTEREGEEC